MLNTEIGIIIRNNQNGTRVKHLIEAPQYLLYHSEEHTRYSENWTTQSTIYLALTNNVTLNTMCTHEDLESDHRPITLKLRTLEKSKLRRIKDLDHANWTKYQKHISENWRMIRAFTDEQQIKEAIGKLFNTGNEGSEII